MQKFNDTKKNTCLDKMKTEGPPQEGPPLAKGIHVKRSLSSCLPVNNDEKLPKNSKIHVVCLFFICLCINSYKIHLYSTVIRLT